MTTDLVLTHIAGLTLAVGAAFGVSAGQLGLGAHTAAHLGDQGAVGVLKPVLCTLVLLRGALNFFTLPHSTLGHSTAGSHSCCRGFWSSHHQQDRSPQVWWLVLVLLLLALVWLLLSLDLLWEHLLAWGLRLHSPRHWASHRQAPQDTDIWTKLDKMCAHLDKDKKGLKEVVNALI